MPNWCNNTITISHSDPAMMDRVFNSLSQGKFLNEFFPCPAELHEHSAPQQDEVLAQQFLEKHGASDWYQWQVAHWGTKWDVGGNATERVDANTVEASFDSAWSPPTQAYEQLVDLGFEIRAYYYEPGMCYCGVWTGSADGYDDDYREYSEHSAESVRQAVGEELDDYWGISDSMASYEEDYEDQ